MYEVWFSLGSMEMYEVCRGLGSIYDWFSEYKSYAYIYIPIYMEE